MICYVQNNIAYPLFDDVGHYSNLESVKRMLTGTPSSQNDDVLYVNVAYDKKLINYNHPYYGFPEGQIDITNREKLLQFVQVARKSNNYKYIFLDVRFEKGYEDFDSLRGKTVDKILYQEIIKTPRVVISHHSDIEIADSTLLSKTALNDYYGMINKTGMARYQYLSKDGKSVALKMYNDINGKDINKHGLLYTSNGSLCYNCPFLHITHEFPNKYDEDGNFQYYNLGVDLLDVYSDDEIANMIKDKIVIIGDFVEDLHDTYKGQQPGSFITYNAYTFLAEGKHLVKWSFVTFSFIFFIFISFYLFSNINIIDHLPFVKSHSSGIFYFILSLLGFSTLMLITADLMYLLYGETTSIWFPSLYFSVFSTILKYLHK